VVGTAYDSLPDVANAAIVCGGCGVDLHLGKRYPFIERVPMLRRGVAAPPPGVENPLVIEPMRGASHGVALTSVSDALNREIARTQGDRPRILYHYTSMAGFQGIVESGTVWVSDLSFLNDRSELIHASRIIEEELASAASQASPLVVELLTRAKLTVSPDDPSIGYYAICFCEGADLLSQWRVYGEGGRGFALGFDSCGFPPSFSLRKVVYDVATQRDLVRRAIHSIADLLVETAAGRSIETLDQAGIMPDFARFLGAHLEEFLALFKNPAFSEENEWRAILRSFRHDHLDALKFRGAGALLVPYFAGAFSDGRVRPSLPLLEVVHGPSMHPELKKKAAHLLLERQSYEHVEVRGSTTPIRV
jgi:hypothetical protein